MTALLTHVPIIKSVGSNGQISLGKKFAGRQVLLTEDTDGTITLKPGRFIPDTEMWLYKNGGEKRLDKALEWATKTSRKDNSNEIIDRLENV